MYAKTILEKFHFNWIGSTSMLWQCWVALFHGDMECLLIAVVQFKWQNVLVNLLYRQQYQVNLGKMFEKVNVIAVSKWRFLQENYSKKLCDDDLRLENFEELNIDFILFWLTCEH